MAAVGVIAFLADVKSFLVWGWGERVSVGAALGSTPYCAGPLIVVGIRARSRISGGMR